VQNKPTNSDQPDQTSIDQMDHLLLIRYPHYRWCHLCSASAFISITGSSSALALAMSASISGERRFCRVSVIPLSYSRSTLTLLRHSSKRMRSLSGFFNNRSFPLNKKIPTWLGRVGVNRDPSRIRGRDFHPRVHFCVSLLPDIGCKNPRG